MTKIEARRRLFVRWAHVSRCASCWQGGAYTGGDGCARWRDERSFAGNH